jgi:hypothetical protein
MLIARDHGTNGFRIDAARSTKNTAKSPHAIPHKQQRMNAGNAIRTFYTEAVRAVE